VDGRDQRLRAVKARDEFLTSGLVPEGSARALIVQSWRRSNLAGVRADLAGVPWEEIDPQCSLARCAEPVLTHFEQELAELPVSIVLTDAQGRLLGRRESRQRLRKRLDAVLFSQGFCYAEAHVGTNGVGTALEEGRAVFVHGPEHFNELIQSFSCAGAPIRSPITGRIEGIVDLSCLAEDANPIMRTLVQAVARDIEQRMLERASTAERMMLDAFLAARRGGKSAVLGISEGMVLADDQAVRLLTPADQVILKARAEELASRPPGSVTELSLSGGRWAQVRCTPISVAGRVIGMVMKIVPRSLPERSSAGQCPRPVTLPGAVGESEIWKAACAEAREAARCSSPLLLVGEPSTGKLTLARGAHQDRWPGSRFLVVDCADQPASWHDTLEVALDQPGSTLVLRHLELLTPTCADSLVRQLERVSSTAPRPWVVGTLRAATGVESSNSLLRFFASSVTVPALRHRAEDLHQLVPLLFDRLAPRRQVQCTPDALRTLVGYAWPGNVAQLQQVLSGALARRPVGDIRAEDLPAECFSYSHRVLTPLESLERDAIVEALRRSDGHRARAAKYLGVSRSSLYRKMRTYRIE
jgi:transcriptional regulator of acetoin/glycerol metabolism